MQRKGTRHPGVRSWVRAPLLQKFWRPLDGKASCMFSATGLPSNLLTFQGAGKVTQGGENSDVFVPNCKAHSVQSNRFM